MPVPAAIAPERRVEILRALTADDLPAVRAGARGVVKARPLAKLSHVHHVVAQMLAKGDKDIHEVAASVGLGVDRIRALKAQPIFKEALEGYKAKRLELFGDVLELQRQIEMRVLEEIQQRLDEKPEDWRRGELIALAEQLARARGAGNDVRGVGGGSVNVSVKFVQAAAPVVDGNAAAVAEAVDVKFEDVA